MHPIEYRRSSNSGKNLLSLSPSLFDIQVYLWGVKPTEELIEQIYQSSSSPNSTFILFPSPSSLSIPQYLEQIAENKNTTNGKEREKGEKTEKGEKREKGEKGERRVPLHRTLPSPSFLFFSF